LAPDDELAWSWFAGGSAGLRTRGQTPEAEVNSHRAAVIQKREQIDPLLSTLSLGLIARRLRKPSDAATLCADPECSEVGPLLYPRFSASVPGVCRRSLPASHSPRSDGRAAGRVGQDCKGGRGSLGEFRVAHRLRCQGNEGPVGRVSSSWTAARSVARGRREVDLQTSSCSRRERRSGGREQGRAGEAAVALRVRAHSAPVLLHDPVSRSLAFEPDDCSCLLGW